MQKFNVGDKVIINYKSEIYSNYNLNNIPGIIVGSDSEGMRYQVEHFDKKNKCTKSEIFHIDWLSKEPNNKMFKIGGEVYVNTSIYTNQKFTILEIGEFDIVVKDKKELIYHFNKKFVSRQPINAEIKNANNRNMKTPEQIDSEIKNLEDQINRLKKEKEDQNFEIGDWFVATFSTGGDFQSCKIYEIVKIEKQNNITYLIPRFHENGENKKNNGLDIRYAKKATPAEIEAYLIKLAEESGLKIGGTSPEIEKLNYLEPKQIKISQFKLKYSGDHKNSMSCNSYMDENGLKYGLAICYNNGFCSIPFDYISYQKSKFQPKITINNCDAEFCAGYVKFGCAKFDNEIFQEAKKFIDLVKDKNIWGGANKIVTNIKLGAGIFTPTDIENIVKQLKD